MAVSSRRILPKGLSRRDAYRQIAPYVKFTWGHYETTTRGKNKGKKHYVPPTESEKKKVVRYWTALVGGSSQFTDAHGHPKSTGGLLSTPRSLLTRRFTRNQRELAKHYSRIPRGYPGLRGVLVPVANPDKPPTIRFEKTASGVEYMVVGEDGVDTRNVPFDAYEDYRGEVGEDPEGVVARLLNDVPGDAFLMQCGDHLAKSSINRDGVAGEVRRYIETYTVDNGHKSDWQDWFFGVAIADYVEQKSWDEYMAHMAANDMQVKADTKAVRSGRRNKKPILSPQGRKRKHHGINSHHPGRQKGSGGKGRGRGDHGHASAPARDHRTGRPAVKRPKGRG